MRRALLLVTVLLVAFIAYLLLYARGKERPGTRQSGSPVPAQSQLEPLPPPRLAPPTQGREAGATTRTGARDEASLMQALRDSVRSNPQLAESLAREGRRRFDDSPDSDERDALLVDALVNQQHIGAARSETYYYLDHHPNGRFAEHLFVMTGVHPMPKPPAAR